jgi:Flp pilus assembly protein TadD
VNRGFVYGTKGNYERAIEDFNRAITLAPNSADALLNRGITKHQKGDYIGGRADIAQAKLMKPDIDD